MQEQRCPGSVSCRAWIQRDAAAAAGDREGAAQLSVLSYNVLSEYYCSKKQFPYCEDRWLSWEHRLPVIVAELLQLRADVICLQEVMPAVFEDELLPVLQEHGYVGSYAQKMAKTEGCAMFVNAEKIGEVQFDCMVLAERFAATLGTAPAAYPHLGYSLAQRSEVAQAATFTLNGVQITVCNSHLYWNPQEPDLKAVQACLVLDWLNSTTAPRENHAVIWAGDFNSLPLKTKADGFDRTIPPGGLLSGVYTLITEGRLNVEHPHHPFSRQPQSRHAHMEGSDSADCWELKPLRNSRVLASSFAVVNSRDDLPACKCEPRYTNYTGSFKGTLDYIFYSPDGGLLTPVEVLDIPRESLLAAEVALPNCKFPSDHLPVMAKFVVTQRAGAS